MEIFRQKIRRLHNCCDAQKVLDTNIGWVNMKPIAASHKTFSARAGDRSESFLIFVTKPTRSVPTRKDDMTLPTPEQFAATQKAGLEALFGLTSKAFEGAIKLAELNIETARSAFAEGQEQAQRALSAKDPQGFFALQAGLAQPAAEKALAYGRNVYGIVSATQAEFATAAQSQLETQQRAFESFVDNAAKNAPAGSEAAVAAIKSALNTANSAYASVNKAAKQAVEFAESNFDAAGKAATKAVAQASARAAKQSA
jgi:phasin family protein